MTMQPEHRHQVDERVASSKARLSDKLSELAHRVDAARDAVQPAQLIRRPWVRFGMAALAGYIIGSRAPRFGPSILAPLLKEAVLVLGSTALRRVARDYIQSPY
jgi:hypothetical protein